MSPQDDSKPKSASSASFEPVSAPQVPRNPDGTLPVNLYIYLPSPKTFIIFVPAGEKYTYARQTALSRHSIPTLFLKSADGSGPIAGSLGEVPEELAATGPQSEAELKSIFADISATAGEAPPGALARLEKLADDIIQAVAPDVEDLPARMRKNAEYLWLMSDVAALTSIASLVAAANGFDSRKSLREIVCACLVMDLPLVKISEEQMTDFYRDPAKAPLEVKKAYEQHPLDAYRLAKSSLRHFTDTTIELVLTHHELYNGKGFPRHVRSGQLFPMARVMALAADSFELMKQHSARGTAKALTEVFEILLEDKVEPQSRRHPKNIVEKSIQFIRGDL